MIETERLILRKWKESDYKTFIEMNQDKDVMEFFPSTLTKEETLSMIERIKKHFEVNNFGLFAVELKETSEFIGFLGLSIPRFEADFMPCVEIGWRLHKKYWNNGYATEAGKACLRYAFEELNLEEVVSFTAKINKKSIKVMEKIGMEFDLEFDHPNVKDGSELKPHVLYKIRRK